jgi:hypothetical protein
MRSSVGPMTSSVDPTTSSVDLITSSVDPTTSSVDPTTSSVDPMTSSVDPITSSVDPIVSSRDPKASPFGSRRGSCASKERLCARRTRVCARLGLRCRRQVAACTCPTCPCHVRRHFGRSNTSSVGVMTSSVAPMTCPTGRITSSVDPIVSGGDTTLALRSPTDDALRDRPARGGTIRGAGRTHARRYRSGDISGTTEYPAPAVFPSTSAIGAIGSLHIGRRRCMWGTPVGRSDGHIQLGSAARCVHQRRHASAPTR